MKVIAILALILSTTALGADAPDSSSARRNARIERITKLVQDTESRDIKLKAELQQLEYELTEAYAGFELDEERIKELQERIAVAQRDLLVNYHRLQVGVRKVMGEQDYLRIKLRIDHHRKTLQGQRQNAEKPASGILAQP